MDALDGWLGLRGRLDGLKFGGWPSETLTVDGWDGRQGLVDSWRDRQVGRFKMHDQKKMSQ